MYEWQNNSDSTLVMQVLQLISEDTIIERYNAIHIKLYLYNYTRDIAS